MKIFKLSPHDLGSVHWSSSSYKGLAIVRAEDEEEARDIATKHFLILARKRTPGQETPRSPWNDSKIVKCIEVANSKYSTEGDPVLLEPESFEM